MDSSPAIHRLDDGFRWPGGRRVAVIFNVAYEAWADGHAPGIGPMGNPLPGGTLGSIVAVPLTMEINDLPHAMRFGRSPQQFVDLFTAHLEHVLADEVDALLIDVTAHAHVYGRPSGAWAYGAIAPAAASRDDVWVAPRAEVARHVIETSRTRGGA